MEEITLMEDPEQEGTNRGFAFLEFSTHLEATNALVRLQKPDVFFGTELRAKVAFAKSGIEPDEEVMAQVKSVFVDGLPPSWDEERVLEKFKSYAEIEEVELARNMPAAKRKDFGFISFRTREAALACIEGVNKNEVNEEGDKKVTLKATLRKPQQKGRVGAGYGRVPWVRGMGAPATRFGGEGGRGFLDERRQFQHFGRAYDNRRPSGPAPARRNYREHEEDSLDRRGPARRNYREHEEDYLDRRGPARRNYREDEDYLDRRALPSARPAETVSSYSYEGDYGYRGAAGYSESVPPRRPVYPEDSYSYSSMNGISTYHGGAAVCGSKCPYSDVGDDFQSPGPHSSSRLDYSLGGAAADSRYKRVSRQGQDSQQAFSAGSRTAASYSNDVGGGQYASGGYERGRGNRSASYY